MDEGPYVCDPLRSCSGESGISGPFLSEGRFGPELTGPARAQEQLDPHGGRNGTGFQRAFAVERPLAGACGGGAPARDTEIICFM